MALFDRFKKQDKEKLEASLAKTKTSLFAKLNTLVRGKDYIDEEVLDELEQILITSDVGVKTTVDIIERLEARVAKDQYVSTDELNTIMRSEIGKLLEPLNSTLQLTDAG